MANNYYSSLYGQIPFRGGAPVFSAQAQNVITRAQDFASLFSFTLTATTVLGVGDIIHLIPATPAGFRVTRAVLGIPDYDSGTTLTWNLGFLSQALGAGVKTGQTIGQSAGTFSLADADVLAASAAVGPQAATLNLLPAGANDELVMYITAAATGAGGGTTTNCLIEAIIP